MCCSSLTHVYTRRWIFLQKSMTMADSQGLQLHSTCAALGFECQSCTFVCLDAILVFKSLRMGTLHRPISDLKVNGFQESKNLLRKMQGCSMVLVLWSTRPTLLEILQIYHRALLDLQTEDTCFEAHVYARHVCSQAFGCISSLPKLCKLGALWCLIWKLKMNAAFESHPLMTWLLNGSSALTHVLCNDFFYKAKSINGIDLPSYKMCSCAGSGCSQAFRCKVKIISSRVKLKESKKWLPIAWLLSGQYLQ